MIPTIAPSLLTLTDDDRAMLIAALDSHIYWQLSDEHYRDNGAVLEPGSDDEDTRAAIAHANALIDRIHATAV